MGLSNGTKHPSIAGENALTFMYSKDYSYNGEQNDLNLRLKSQEFI